MKKLKIIYWVITLVFIYWMFTPTISSAFNYDYAVDFFTKRLGFPAYFLPYTGFTKLLGLVALLIPGFPRIKEWVYAGFTYDLVAAIYSLIAIGMPVTSLWDKPREEVFDYIKLIEIKSHIVSKWLSLDPDTKIELRGEQDGTAGSILAFESKSNKTGKGEWETKKITEGERIDFELRFLAPFVFTANGHLSTVPLSAAQTKIIWIYNSGMDWPMNFMLLFMDMDKIIGTDIAESLNNMKTQLENS